MRLINWKSLFVFGACLLSASLFLSFTTQYWLFTADDAFITFRYARNWVLSGQPVFNVKASPAEGYTTFLWMATMTLPFFLKIDVLTFAKILGLGLTLATFGLIYLYVKTLTQNTIAALVALGLATLCSTFMLHAVAGMETALFTFLLTLLFYLTYRYAATPTTLKLGWLLLGALLLGLTRPEGNLAAGASLTALFFLLPTQRAQLVRHTLLFYILPGALYFAARAFYYGTWLPLPFYIKVITPQGLAGVSEVQNYFVHFGSRLGLSILAALPLWRKTLFAPVVAASTLVIFFLFPQHLMGYSWRYLFPLTPFLFVLAGLGVANLLTLKRFRWLQVLGWLAVGGVTLSAAWSFNQFRFQESEDAKWYGYSLENAHVKLGRKLAEFDQPLTLAIGDAGAVPYYSGWRTVDTFGLNDKVIALRGHDPQYVLDQYPDVLVLMSRDEKKFVPLVEWEAPLYMASDERGLRVTRVLNFNYYYLWVLTSPAEPITTYLQHW